MPTQLSYKLKTALEPRWYECTIAIMGSGVRGWFTMHQCASRWNTEDTGHGKTARDRQKGGKTHRSTSLSSLRATRSNVIKFEKRVPKTLTLYFLLIKLEKVDVRKAWHTCLENRPFAKTSRQRKLETQKLRSGFVSQCRSCKISGPESGGTAFVHQKPQINYHQHSYPPAAPKASTTSPSSTA